MNHFVRILACAAIVSSAAYGQIRVPFLEDRPVIDGIPDSVILHRTDAVPLALIAKSSGKNPDCTADLRMAYGVDFFYLAASVQADSISYRDRAYQNGDGFHLTIARPMPDSSATDEFYVLRFSPGDAARSVDTRIGVWYYNRDLQSTRLRGSQLRTSVSGGRAWFEALIPWKEIHPYHPFRDGVGFNFCFVKAVGADEKTLFFLHEDEGMQGEDRPRRYIIPEFTPPRHVRHSQIMLSLSRAWVEEGTSADTAVLHCVSPVNRTVHAVFESADSNGTLQVTSMAEFSMYEGVNRVPIALPVAGLAPGSYTIRCRIDDGALSDTARLMVLQKTEYDTLRSRVGTMPCSEGTRRTLLFHIADAERSTRRLKPYESGVGLRLKLARLHAMILRTGKGEAFGETPGVHRRAFISAVDTTLMPYSIRVPESYTAAKRYPLLVFLHGSGGDDLGALTQLPLTDGTWIELAPNGRGISNCFTTDHAQEDIEEAISDAVKNYSIDTSMIVIAGFSMGGYGAYRTFYEHPGRYKGVAVISGHPNLAARWIGPGHPDFLDSTYLSCFRRVPVFIYHNENDRNCPYALTRQAIDALRRAGADVESVTTAEGGHALIDERSRARYLAWLKSRLNTMNERMNGF